MRQGQTSQLGSKFVWEAPQKSIKQGMEDLKKQFRALEKNRQQTQRRDAAANRRVSVALSKEWERAGINLSNIAAVSLANAAGYEADFKKYRNRKRPAAVKDPRFSSYLSSKRTNLAPMPSNFLNFTRFAPFDVAGVIPPSQNPTPTTFFFFNSDTDGSMIYFQDTPITSPTPSNFVCGGAVGILFTPPPFFGVPFPGVAFVQMGVLGVEMSGSVGANIFGESHSEGNIGWAVQEFDQNFNFIGTVQFNWWSEFYLDANTFNQSSSAFVAPPAFTSSTSFSTAPQNNYIIWATLWGNIDAAGDQGWNSSRAASFGQGVLSSMTLTWNPMFVLF